MRRPSTHLAAARPAQWNRDLDLLAMQANKSDQVETVQADWHVQAFHEDFVTT